MKYLALFVVGFFAALTPGPDIFFVIKEGLVRRSLSFIAVLGILCGNIIYLILVAFGVNKIGESLYFQFIIGVIGGVYLLKLSYLTFKENVSLTIDNKIYSFKETFKKAFFLNISNPKAMLFFVAVVTPFMG
ncbi:MAG TPA: LysE family translocator, partial [Nautiliaceae bacterium]|nr:LysE family translocator [Nautiliaceae bacterium]